MSTLSKYLILGILIATIAGCSDSPTNNDQATVTMQGEIESAAVTSTAQKGSVLAHGGNYADSLKITRVRILISELKLHRDKEDSIQGDRMVKTGPIMLQLDPSGAKAFASAPLPAGTYDKLKFEFHRFSSSEISLYLNDTVFADFVTNERSTVVIEGIVYVDGVATPFEFKSGVTANLEFKFDPSVTLNTGANTNLVVVVNAGKIFRESQSTKIHDPRDPRNQSELDGAIHAAFHCLKR